MIANRSIVVVLSLVLTVVIPLLMIYWVANRRSKCRVHLSVKTCAAVMVIAALFVGMVWPVTSHYLRYFVVFLFLGAVVHTWRQGRQMVWWQRPARIREWGSLGVGVVTFAVFGILLSQVVGAGRVPDGAVELDFPFQEGAFVAMSAGSRPLMNAHLGTRDVQLYRGQSWALDIVQLDRLGRRARGVYPAELNRYRIFGTPVLAPCSGAVSTSVNDLPDHPPPEHEPDVANAPGNYLLIHCDEGFYVVLAHLAKGSIRVNVGNRIAPREVVGVIGNSGRTTEPHLHINAQAGPGDEFLLDADPLPILFRGHGFLKRNDVVRARR
jgi:hypothetical protein